MNVEDIIIEHGENLRKISKLVDSYEPLIDQAKEIDKLSDNIMSQDEKNEYITELKDGLVKAINDIKKESEAKKKDIGNAITASAQDSIKKSNDVMSKANVSSQSQILAQVAATAYPPSSNAVVASLSSGIVNNITVASETINSSSIAQKLEVANKAKEFASDLSKVYDKSTRITTELTSLIK